MSATVTPAGNVVMPSPSSAASLVPTGTYTTGSSMMSMTRAIWIFIVLAIVVIVVVAWFGRRYKCVKDSLNEGSWNNQWLFGGILLGIALLITAWATGKAFTMTDSTNKNFLMISFVAIGILLILAFALFFSKQNYSGAFYTSLLIVAIAILLMYFTWKVDSKLGWWQLPFVVMSIALVAFFWDITSKNSNGDGCVQEEQKY